MTTMIIPDKRVPVGISSKVDQGVPRRLEWDVNQLTRADLEDTCSLCVNIRLIVAKGHNDHRGRTKGGRLDCANAKLEAFRSRTEAAMR